MKGPFVKFNDEATKVVHPELRETTNYLRRHSMKVTGNKIDATFTEFVLVHGKTMDQWRYINIHLPNQTEELFNSNSP